MRLRDGSEPRALPAGHARRPRASLCRSCVSGCRAGGKFSGLDQKSYLAHGSVGSGAFRRLVLAGAMVGSCSRGPGATHASLVHTSPIEKSRVNRFTERLGTHFIAAFNLPVLFLQTRIPRTVEPLGRLS